MKQSNINETNLFYVLKKLFYTPRALNILES